MKLFKKMRQYAENHVLFISVFMAIIITIIFMGVNETGVLLHAPGYVLVFKGLVLFVVLFMGMFSMIAFEQMTDRYRKRIARQDEEIHYLRALLVERDTAYTTFKHKEENK